MVAREAQMKVAMDVTVTVNLIKTLILRRVIKYQKNTFKKHKSISLCLKVSSEPINDMSLIDC